MISWPDMSQLFSLRFLPFFIHCTAVPTGGEFVSIFVQRDFLRFEIKRAFFGGRVPNTICQKKDVGVACFLFGIVVLVEKRGGNREKEEDVQLLSTFFTVRPSRWKFDLFLVNHSNVAPSVQVDIDFD